MSFLLVVLVVLGYLIGSIPFGLVLTRLVGMEDIRTIGSGNIGATNVLRTGNTLLAFMTLLLDGIKGAAMIAVAHFFVSLGWLDHHMVALVGGAAVIGHIFPVWLCFKGGKGVATFLAVVLALDWLLGLFVCALWLAVFVLTRISSLSAIVAMVGVLGSVYVVYIGTVSGYVLLGLALLVIVRHYSNIKRLCMGDEKSFKKRDLS